MKLAENGIDDEKVITNSENIEKLKIEKPLVVEPSNGDVHNHSTEIDESSNSNPPGAGDLLVEDTNQSRHENEDYVYPNGHRGDDSRSVSSNSSNFRIAEQDYLSEEEITLRLSDDEDASVPVLNESASSDICSSPIPKTSEDQIKNNSPIMASVQTTDCSKNTEETIDTFSDSETKDNTSPVKSVHSDDNLEHLISDLNEQSKSALKSENKSCSVSDLRREIEDFIKNHDNEDDESFSTDLNRSNEDTDSSQPNPAEDLDKSKITEDDINNSEDTNESKITEESATIESDKNLDTQTSTEDSSEKQSESQYDQTVDLFDAQPELEAKVLEEKDLEENFVKNEPENETYEMNIDQSQEMEVNNEINEIKTDEITIEEKDIQQTSNKETDNLENIDNVAENEIKTENSSESYLVKTSNILTKKIEEMEENSFDNSFDEDDPPEISETIDENLVNSETNEDYETSCQTVNESEKIETETDLTDTSQPEASNSEENEPEAMTVDSSHEEQPEIVKDIVENDKIEENTSKEEIVPETNVELSEKSEKNESKDEISQQSISIDDVEMKEIEDQKDEKQVSENDTKEDLKKSKVEPDLATKKEETEGKEKSTLKRSLEEHDESNQDAKKQKINGIKTPAERIKFTGFRNIMSQKKISKLTRAELEQFCLQKMCEVLTQTSRIAELHRKLMQQQEYGDKLLQKYQTVTKHVKDLEIVHSRVLSEVRSKCKDNNIEVTPVKITRSVGLQVSLQAVLGARPRPIPAPIQQNNTTAGSNDLKRKINQRASLPNRLPSQASMPPPRGPAKSPNSAKGIKTILPKVYPPAEQKDNSVNNSLLENYLQNQNNSTTTKSTSLIRRSAPQSTPPSPSNTKTSESTAKVIDLTDEDDIQKAAASPIRVLPSSQLQNTTSTVSASLPRLTTYLVQGNQQGQQVLLATSAAQPSRPGQPRPTIMFKPVTTQGVQPGQRLNLVRPNQVSGITVLPTNTTSTIRSGTPIRFASTITSTRPQVRTQPAARHPAPLPGPPAVQPSQPNWKAMPPKPTLKISRVGDGIVLSWRMQNNKDMSLYEDIGSYQLYAYQETNSPPSTEMWRKVGDVKALALPMACTLTQFTDGNKYHFAVRAVDVKSRVGPFSQPEQIALP